MSVRLVLNVEGVINAGGFRIKGIGGNSGSMYLCLIGPGDIAHNAHLNDVGQAYISTDPMEPIPDIFKGFVVGASEHVYFGVLGSPIRRTGEYKYKSATAVLRSSLGNVSHRYVLELFAEKLEDLVSLKRLILEGKIWPDVDYEASQVPPPLRNLRELVREFWQILRRDVSNKLYGIKTRFS